MTANFVSCLLVTISLLSHTTASAVEDAQKPRVIVLTDISNEPDDEQSLVRFLVYTNEFDVEGLIATTSVWLRDQVRRDLLLRQIEAYEKVRGSLQVHADGFPTADHLRSVTRRGLPEFGMLGVGDDKNSPGSQLIIEAVDREDSRPLWVSVWGGANCLAQALWEVRKTRSPEAVDEFVSKIRVYTISDQDDSGRWMRLQFPGLFYVVSPSTVDHREYYRATWTGISGDRFYRNGPLYKFELVDNPWLEENVIKNHGPLGTLYPKLEYIMEGDTPSFLGLINNGLGSQVSPSFGGWGGRYVLYQSYGEERRIWTNNLESRDTVTLANGQTYTSNQATIWRWREAYQHDLAARMDWCIADTYEKANHNPVAVVDGVTGKEVIEMSVKPGSRIVLDSDGSFDPDGVSLSFNWFQYREAGDYQGSIEIEGANSPRASFTIPSQPSQGTIHIILEVRDNGSPSLFAYRRVVLTAR